MTTCLVKLSTQLDKCFVCLFVCLFQLVKFHLFPQHKCRKLLLGAKSDLDSAAKFCLLNLSRGYFYHSCKSSIMKACRQTLPLSFRLVKVDVGGSLDIIMWHATLLTNVLHLNLIYLLKASWRRKEHWNPRKTCNFGRLHNHYRCRWLVSGSQEEENIWLMYLFWILRSAIQT